MNSSVQKSRRSTIKACSRCHRRKQRCVGYPACTNCRTAKLPCSRDSTPLMRRLAGLSKEELINKIEALHKQLPSPALDRDVSGSHGTLVPSPTEPTADPVIEDVGLLEAAPSPEASTSTATQYPAEAFESPGSYLSCSELIMNAQAPNAAQFDTIPPATDPAKDPAEINLEDGRELLVIFLESVHRRLPFCDYAELVETLHRAASASSRSSISAIQGFRLNMACAMGAKVRQLTGSSQLLPSEHYILKAAKIEDRLDKANPVEVTERLLWHITYQLRSSFSPDAWHTIGSAMRTAIEAGLHREHHYLSLAPEEANMHRRIFWSVYILERNVARHLKRPLSISDLDIDVELPFPATYQIPWDPDHGQSPDSISMRPLDLDVFIAVVRLVRINSQAYTCRYRACRQARVKQHILVLLQRIRELEASLKSFSEPDREFLHLQINNSIMNMTEPFLSSDDQFQDSVTVCLDAAGGVCRLFKRQRLERRLGYSFTMVNSVFTAGVIICYIIYRNPFLWTPTRANEMRVCSAALFASAARNGAVRKYCEVLDTVIEAVSEYVEDSVTTAALTGERDQGSGSTRAQAVFDGLGRMLEEKAFEFPAQSYPCGSTKAAGDASWVPFRSTPGDNVLDMDFLDFATCDMMDSYNEPTSGVQLFG